MLSDQQIEIISARQPQAFLESWYELADESHFWFRWRFEAMLRQLRELNLPLREKLKALDVGGGTGVLRAQVEAVTDWEVDIADLDYNALHRARPGRGRVLFYDVLEERQELRERYDVVLLFDVLEHIEHTQPFISALLTHLKVGGRLLINVPALQSLYSRYDEVQGHYRRYNAAILLEEFRRFALDVKDLRYWGLANLPIIFARKLWLALSPEQGREAVFQQGFRLPNRLVNEVFLNLMRLEMKIMKRSPLGSSILMVGEKRG